MIKFLREASGVLVDRQDGIDTNVRVPSGHELDAQHVRDEGEKAVLMIGPTLTLWVDRDAIRRL